MRYLQNFVITFVFCPYFYSMINLKNVKTGKYYKILDISQYATDKIRRRLLELGFTSGEYIKIIRKSLIGKTLLVEIRGYILSIRDSISQNIIVDVV